MLRVSWAESHKEIWYIYSTHDYCRFLYEKYLKFMEQLLLLEQNDNTKERLTEIDVIDRDKDEFEKLLKGLTERERSVFLFHFILNIISIIAYQNRNNFSLCTIA